MRLLALSTALLLGSACGQTETRDLRNQDTTSSSQSEQTESTELPVSNLGLASESERNSVGFYCHSWAAAWNNKNGNLMYAMDVTELHENGNHIKCLYARKKVEIAYFWDWRIQRYDPYYFDKWRVCEGWLPRQEAYAGVSEEYAGGPANCVNFDTREESMENYRARGGRG